MSYLINTKVPYRYAGKQLDELITENAEEVVPVLQAYLNDLISVEKHGNNLFLYSKTNGTGKTMAAYCLMQEILKPRFRWDRNRHEVTKSVQPTSVVAVKLSDYLDIRLDQYNAESQADKQSIYEASFLILDEFSKSALTRNHVSDRRAILSLISYRLEHGLPTIYSSNVPPEKFKEIFGPNVAARLHENIQHIEFCGSDARPLLNTLVTGEEVNVDEARA